MVNKEQGILASVVNWKRRMSHLPSCQDHGIKKLILKVVWWSYLEPADRGLSPCKKSPWPNSSQQQAKNRFKSPKHENARTSLYRCIEQWLVDFNLRSKDNDSLTILQCRRGRGICKIRWRLEKCIEWLKTVPCKPREWVRPHHLNWVPVLLD